MKSLLLLIILVSCIHVFSNISKHVCCLFFDNSLWKWHHGVLKAYSHLGTSPAFHHNNILLCRSKDCKKGEDKHDFLEEYIIMSLANQHMVNSIVLVYTHNLEYASIPALFFNNIHEVINSIIMHVLWIADFIIIFMRQ